MVVESGLNSLGIGDNYRWVSVVVIFLLSTQQMSFGLRKYNHK